MTTPDSTAPAFANLPSAQESSGPPAVRPQPSRQRVAENLLQRIRDNHLSIRLDWQAMMGAHSERRAATESRAAFLRPPPIHFPAPTSEEERQRWMDWLDRQAALQPDPMEASALLNRIEAVLTPVFKADEARIAVALMVDAYPNARPHSPEAYIASIMDELKGAGVSTVAVSWACHDLKTTSTFVPSLAEVAEKAKAASETVEKYRDWLAHYLAWTKVAAEAGAWLQTVELAAAEAEA